MTKCPLSGRVHGRETPSRILHLRNMSGTAEARVVKFCVLACYVNAGLLIIPEKMWPGSRDPF